MGSSKWMVYNGTSENGTVPPNGWFLRENPSINWMIWGYPDFRKPPYGYAITNHYLTTIHNLKSHSIPLLITINHYSPLSITEHTIKLSIIY
jgi:hypothetical protein